MSSNSRIPWRVARRDFLKASSAAIAGWTLPGDHCATRPSVYGLETTASTDAGIRFGLVSDSHYANREPGGTRYYAESLKKMRECVALMNDQHVSFLIELGDFKDQGSPPEEKKTLEYLRHIEGVFNKFMGPRFHALGNHDMDSISKSQFLTSIENTGIPKDRSYFSFDIQGLHCLVLDANYRADGSDYNHGNFNWTDPNVPAAELHWLEQDLAKTSGPVILFMHQRLDGTGDVFVTNGAEVRDVLEKSGKVLAVFHGHDHHGAIQQIHGIHYYTVKALVEGSGAEQNSYAIVELSQNGDITVTGYQRATSMALPHTAD